MAVTLFFASPFFVTILSKLILNEVVGIRRWGAVIVGFIGVYLVMNPEFDNFNLYTIFPVLTALAYALTIIIQVKTSHKDSLFAQTFHIFLATSILALISGFVIGGGQYDIYQNEVLHLILRKWELSFSVNLFLLIIVGFIGVSALLLLFQAYRIASPATIAPFEYILIFYALVIGFVFWDETIDSQTLFGLIFIISAGIYTFVREVKRKKEISVKKPLR